MSSFREQHRHALLGVAYVVVLALLVWLSIAAYTKALPWQRTAHVDVVVSHAGLELNRYADVKLQGRVVGKVRGTRSDGRRTVIELGINPDELDLIPADLDAAVVPKTLFGEKFVDLLPRANASSARLADGATITQSTSATEIGDVYSRLVPVLKALDPARLTTVLSTLAATLEGRGAQIGRTLDNLGTFLGDLDPHLDTLDIDLRLLARTLDGYDAAAPDVLTNLANATALSNDLLIPAEERLKKFLATITDLSDTSREVLADNGEGIVTLVTRGEPLLGLLEEYAPMLACSIDGLRLVDLHGNQTTGSRGPYVLLSIDMFIMRQPYDVADDLPSNPDSDASLNKLPAPIRSWEPHCPRFGDWVHQAVDAEPRSLRPMPNQVLSNEGDLAAQGRTSSTDGTDHADDTTAGAAARANAIDPQGAKLALAIALARDLLARADASNGATKKPATGDAALGGLLVAPLLGKDPVDVP